MSDFPPIAHVALTVSDLDRSREWYGRLFGSAPVLDEDTGVYHHVVWLMGRTLVGIHKHPRMDSTEAFSELRPGLDHLAFGCADRAELEAWKARLDELGIANGGIVDAPYGSGLSFRDPDNIALEFFSPPGR
ncbi:MAG: VOC family protein [Actinobacteria bacterium]|nr:MAG: VOC family protein [Actinomycetota bacterium]